MLPIDQDRSVLDHENDQRVFPSRNRRYPVAIHVAWRELFYS